MNWKPSLGAWLENGAVRFRVWAPEARSVEVLLENGNASQQTHELEKASGGYFEGLIAGAGADALYTYRIDGRGPFPDPASRFQPAGVHGPSAVVDPGAFAWTDEDWRGLPLEETILYELHLGTFTPEGTFRAAQQRLPYLKELGVTAVELMPVAAFAGERNWGYDCVALYAPARCYGEPGDLRRFVNEAHRLGLAVHLDVVYNHLGPDGAYLQTFSPYYFTERHHTPWGAALNFDGERREEVRRFFIENALHWVHEYHIDGLRLDATHAITDDSSPHILAELAGTVRRSAAAAGRQALIIAEDSRNLAHMVRPAEEGGWALDALWSDDFHHQMRRCLAGDSDGYFQDFSGSVEDIAATIWQGWFYCGQYARYFEHNRGTDPKGLPPQRFVFFIQNHDQAGNRAFGDRLHHKITPPAYRAASVLLLCCPQTPLLFMGQEWAASTPFQYFTDHNEELGRLVTKGRRNEFRGFEAFADAATRETIPDPQRRETFERCILQWKENTEPPHAGVLRLYRDLLELRRAQPANEQADCDVRHAGPAGVLVRRGALLAAVLLQGAGQVDIPGDWNGAGWRKVLSTEDERFADDPKPLSMKQNASSLSVEFSRPGALILRRA